MSEEDLEKKLHDWLRTAGYPLEMRVARKLHERKWETSQSVIYQSSEGKHRELDVTGYIRHGLPRKEDEPWQAFEFLVIIECKSATNRPWIMFSTESTAGPSIFGLKSRAGNSLGKAFLDAFERKVLFDDIEFFRVGDRAGYAVVRAFESGNLDAAYGAVSGLLDAVAAWSEFTANKHTARCRLIFPIIVTTAPVFECYLDANDNERVVRRDSVTLFSHNPVLGEHYAVIEIMNESHLGAYLEKLEKLFEWMWNEHRDAVEESFGTIARKPVEEDPSDSSDEY